MTGINLRKSILGTLLLASLTILSAGSASAAQVSFEEDHSLPIVYVNVAVRGGAVTDPKGAIGLTNFMGEMLLRGTQKHTKEQLDLALDQMGAKLAVETRAEALVVRGAVLKSKLAPFLDLVQEIVTQPNFPSKEIDKLKKETISIIQEELGNDGGLASRKFTRFLFGKHPYGNPIVGRIHDIEHLSRTQIMDHYNHLIQDKNLLVLGTGDAKTTAITDWAQSITNKARSTVAQPEEKSFQSNPPQDEPKPRLLVVDKPDRTQTQINIGQIGLKMTDKDYFPLYLGNYAFGGASFSSILMKEIREKRGWSYGATSHFRFGLQPRSWQLHLFPAAKDTPDALAYSLKLVRDLKENGLTEEQFEFSKQSLINSAGFMYDTPKKRVENQLLEKTLDLPDGFMKSYASELNHISRSQVNAALKRFLKPEKLSISVLGTAKDLKSRLATAAQVSEDQVEVIPYTED